MGISAPNPKTVSHQIGKDQVVLDVGITKKVIETCTLNYQKLNLKKECLSERFARKLTRKNGVCLQERTQNHETRQGKNRKITQLQIPRFWQKKFYTKYQKSSYLTPTP